MKIRKNPFLLLGQIGKLNVEIHEIRHPFYLKSLYDTLPTDNCSGRGVSSSRSRQVIPCDHRTCGNECIFPDGDVADNGGIGPDGGPPLDPGFFIQGFPPDLGPRVQHIGQHTGRP